MDLSRQKELDADPKAVKQIKFVGKLKNSITIIIMLNLYFFK